MKAVWKPIAVWLVVGGALGWACGRPQIPPGPPPEYERPQVEPWDAGPVEDPLANIEAEGEWVGETGGGGAPLQAPDPPAPTR